MARINDEALAHHLEVAIATSLPTLLTELAHGDRYRRSAAASTLAQHLAHRMRRFDIGMDDGAAGDRNQLPLFVEEAADG